MEQQPCDLFKAHPLGQIVNVVAAIKKPGGSIDSADGRLPGDDAFEAGGIGWK